jgi:hypothetical protein
MIITLFEMTSSAAADQIVTDVEAGELWGVDLGTTSKASSYSNYALVQATATRSNAIYNSLPDTVENVLQEDPGSFTDASEEHKAWYLRGKLPE